MVEATPRRRRRRWSPRAEPALRLPPCRRGTLAFRWWTPCGRLPPSASSSSTRKRCVQRNAEARPDGRGSGPRQCRRADRLRRIGVPALPTIRRGTAGRSARPRTPRLRAATRATDNPRVLSRADTAGATERGRSPRGLWGLLRLRPGLRREDLQRRYPGRLGRSPSRWRSTPRFPRMRGCRRGRWPRVPSPRAVRIVLVALAALAVASMVLRRPRSPAGTTSLPSRCPAASCGSRAG